MLLACCLTGARAQLSFTSQELAIYRQRAGLVPGFPSGPFFSQGDTSSRLGPNAPGDFARIRQYADEFRANPSDTVHALWMGYTLGKLDSAGQYPRWQGIKMQAAAFWYLLTGDTSYSGPVLRCLNRQIDIGGSTNLATWPTDRRNYPSYEAAAKEANWLSRLLYAYAWTRPAASPALRQKAEGWFQGSAGYYMIRHVRRFEGNFPNRAQGDYTVRTFLAAPLGVPQFASSDPIYMIADGANNWAGDNRVYKYIDAQGRLGPKVSRLEEIYNNRVAEKMHFVGQLGLLIGRQDLVEEAYRTATEFIRFSISPDGSPGEFERNGDYNSPAQGLWYHAINVQYMVMLADGMARRGDMRLYQFSTTDGAHGTQGGPKSLALVVDYFARACAGKNPHFYRQATPGNRIDNMLETPNRFGLSYMAFDYLIAVPNKFYRNAEWRRIYMHQEPGTVPIPAGGYSTAAKVWLPWAGTGAEILAGYGLHAMMEDQANPYRQCGPGGPRIMGLTLINAGTDQELAPLRSGLVVNLANGPAQAINVRAQTCPDSVGSIEYRLFRILPVTRTDIIVNRPPYALQGFSQGDYASWIPEPGSYRLEARVWSGANRTGTAGPITQVTFTVRAGTRP